VKPILITDEMVFKSAMSRDYRNMQELTLAQENISFLDNNNIVLKQLTALRKLDLSFNKIARIDNLDTLKELRELNLSFNHLENIDNLHKLPQLRTVMLNHNKIRQLENLKGLRKLESLSIIGNLLEDLNVYGPGAEPLLELKEINASKNQI
jgi:Leucine-rich repeat (LRR) protein